MKASSWKQAGLALALLVTAVSTSGARSGGEKSTAYTFQAPPVNSLGVKAMADLLGKPVLIDFWGTR